MSSVKHRRAIRELIEEFDLDGYSRTREPTYPNSNFRADLLVIKNRNWIWVEVGFINPDKLHHILRKSLLGNDELHWYTKSKKLITVFKSHANLPR